METIAKTRPALGLLLATALVCGCGGDEDPVEPTPGDGQDDGGEHDSGRGDAGQNDGGRDDGGQAQVRELDFTQFDDLLETFVQEQGLEGMSAAIVEREQGVVHVRGYGDFAADRVYAIASSSKILSAGVIARLADRGILDLDAPIGDYVGDAWGQGTAEGKAELTLAQLLSMSGGLLGLANIYYEPYACVFGLEGTVEECAQRVYEADNDTELIAPDTEFRYGGATYQLAGGVAIVASGKSWDELVRDTYIEPCGVRSLGYTNFSEDLITEGVVRYPPGFEGNPDNAPETDNYYLGAGAYVTVEDYAKILLMHLRGGLCEDDRVLSEESVARMQVDRIGEVYDGDSGDPFFEGYGLGWWVNRETGVVMDSGGYGSGVWLDNELGYAVILAIEADVAAGGLLFADAFPLLNELFGGEHDGPEPDDTDIPELTTAECIERPHAAPDSCRQCICEHCVSEMAACLLFDEGALCDDYFECHWAHFEECGPGPDGQTDCYYIRDGTAGLGPCADEVHSAAANERGAGSSAVLGGACSRSATDNACAALVAVGACIEAQCPEVCDASGATADMDGGTP